MSRLFTEWIAGAINLAAIISTLLNPIVFRHCYFKKASIASNLYMMLSAMDLLSSIFLSALLSFRILQPKEEACFELHDSNLCEKEYLKFCRRATLTEKALGLVSWSLIYCPVIITSILAICWCFQIKYPLKPLSRGTVLVITTALCIFQGIYFIMLFFLDYREDFTTLYFVHVLKIWNVAPFGIISDIGNISVDLMSFTLLTSLSTVASMLTVFNIARKRKIHGTATTRSQKIYSAIKVLLLSLGCLIAVTLLVCCSTNGGIISHCRHSCCLFPADSSFGLQSSDLHTTY